MKRSAVALLSFLALVSSAFSFAPQLPNERTSVSLRASKSDLSTAALSTVAAAFFALNVASLPASAADNAFDFSGSSQVIAARSGGRAGGRASSGGASYSRPSSSYSSYRSSTTIYHAPPSPTVIVAPPVTYSYSYNPLGGLGLGYAVGAMGNIGNEIRDIRQESEIQRSKIELEQSRMKEAELEARLRGLEAQQAAQQAQFAPQGVK
ncbi:hypothetical protein ACA910_019910 [Epithemia clementina (nom. ined.)]